MLGPAEGDAGAPCTEGAVVSVVGGAAVDVEEGSSGEVGSVCTAIGAVGAIGSTNDAAAPADDAALELAEVAAVEVAH